MSIKLLFIWWPLLVMCIVVHRETISFKKTIQGSFSHLILKIFTKKVLYLWWKQLVFSISGLDYAFLHQIFKTGLIGFQKLMGYFGEAYVNIFNEIEISCNINFSIQPKIVCWVMYFYILISKCHGVGMRVNVFGKIINQSIQTIYFLESLIFIASKVDGNGGVDQQDCGGQCDNWDLWAGWHKLWNRLELYRGSQKKHSYKIFGLEIMLFTCSQTLWWTPVL